MSNNIRFYIWMSVGMVVGSLVFRLLLHATS